MMFLRIHCLIFPRFASCAVIHFPVFSWAMRINHLRTSHCIPLHPHQSMTTAIKLVLSGIIGS